LEEERCVASRDLHEVKAHTEILLPTIHQLLADATWQLQQVELMALTIGPGSFTGIRIGMAAVQALAWTHDIPVVGIDTLRALAAPHWRADRKVLACLDARRGEVYASVTQATDPGDCTEILAPRLWAWESLRERLSQIGGPFFGVGDGVEAYPQLLIGPDSLGPPTDPKMARVQAKWVGRLALAAHARGEGGRAADLRPLYLRVSHAEAMRLGT
jgi:tRNA threonylcarbamoyladenosine biosynthesis protein TsaB